jgi:methylenetetrahydrofolate reductase (NADPH)
MHIKELLARGEPTFSFEFFPPKSDEAASQLAETIADLRELDPSFVSVTYGAGGSTRERTIELVTRLKRETGIEAMAHLTCVGSGRDELRTVLEHIGEAGVHNVLALRGDPPKGQAQFVTAEGGFQHASELVRFIREHHDAGFSVGGACYPETHPECGNPAVDLIHLKRKVDQGLDFLITQLFFDNQRYFEFVERARRIGILVPILAGIMPITNAAQVERFTVSCRAAIPFDLAEELDNRRNDPVAVMELGIAHATAQCVELLDWGAPGIHFYTLNRSTATREIYAGLHGAGSLTHNAIGRAAGGMS